MPSVQVRRTYLQLHSPADLVPGRPVAGASWVRIESPAPGTYRALYRDVGDQWHWQDRRKWTDAQIAEHLSRPEISVWTLRADGDDVGFVELERHADGATEIVYFGLKPPFIGRGLGAEMLAQAVRTAFAEGANRVWLHTCSLDSPMALPNYKARGFTEFGEEVYTAEINTQSSVER